MPGASSEPGADRMQRAPHVVLEFPTRRLFFSCHHHLSHLSDAHESVSSSRSLPSAESHLVPYDRYMR